jgi:hypothetical protein
MSVSKDLEWLSRRTMEYHSYTDDVMGVVDLDELGKLGQCFSSMDDLEKIDIGDGVIPRPTYVSAHLNMSQKQEIIKLLKVYMCCFASDYNEMPRLSRELVEHRLLQAGFIQPCCYADWVSNIVPIEKKNTGKIRICVDFRNLNRATPKDEYPMPIADLLIDSASGNKAIRFLDGNVGYNQIFMVKEDVSKTAFHCPGFVGLFEWVVMTFSLKNAGATYQRAMNLIFHDLLGVLMEVYIDDVVVKLVGFKEHMTDLKLSLETMKKYGLLMNPLKCTFGVTLGRFLGFIVHDTKLTPRKLSPSERLENRCARKTSKSSSVR